MLILQRNLVKTQNKSPDKHVVNTQTFFNQITTDVFARSRTAKAPSDDAREGYAQRNPSSAFNQGFAWTHVMGLAVNNQNVKCQQQKNKTNQRHPSPARNGEINKITFI